MITGIDHVIVAVPDPDEAAAELERLLGLRAGPGGRHEHYGSRNRLIWLGDSYVELLGIDDERLAAGAWYGPRALSVLSEHGAGYVGLSFASDDLAAEMAVLQGQGSVLGAPAEGERRRPDGRIVRWRVAVPPAADPDVGLVFLIQHDAQGAEWTAPERAERARQQHPLGGPVRLTHFELPVREVRATTMRLHRDVGLQFRPSLAGGGARDASAGSQTVRLIAARPGVLPVVAMRGGRSEVDAAAFGCRWLIALR